MLHSKAAWAGFQHSTAWLDNLNPRIFVAKFATAEHKLAPATPAPIFTQQVPEQDVGPVLYQSHDNMPVNTSYIDTSTSTTKTSFLLGDWAALLGVVGGVFGPKKWPSIRQLAKFDKMNKIL